MIWRQRCAECLCSGSHPHLLLCHPSCVFCHSQVCLAAPAARGSSSVPVPGTTEGQPEIICPLCLQHVPRLLEDFSSRHDLLRPCLKHQADLPEHPVTLHIGRGEDGLQF